MVEQTEREGKRPLKVAVVGAGPSGFYAIRALYKSGKAECRVDLFDRLPTPFGLVRGGVAPDHQKIKNVVRVYESIAEDERTRFFGNVTLGVDITIDELSARYDAVILATGNEADRRLGLDGEDLKGVHSATEFVGWYNGHPDFQDRQFDLKNTQRVVIVGNGNVAMDVARVLVRSVESLRETDITEQAIQALSESRVQDIVLLGRRGPAQAAFSPKEIRELSEVDGCSLRVSKDHVNLSDEMQAWLEEHGSRDAHKNFEFLTQIAMSDQTAEHHRTVRCIFRSSPSAFAGQAGSLTGVVAEENELYLDERGHPRPRGTGRTQHIEAQLVFKAIGYRGTPIPGVPFHEAWGIVPNDQGRVLTAPDGTLVERMYVVGWAKRGPTGLIGTNNADSKATVMLLLEDWAAGCLSAPKYTEDVAELLARRSVKVVRWSDWKRLDALEIENGLPLGKVREKFTRIDEMLQAIFPQ
ncbi:MAG: FAD-dependent oxidoreductase [Myxococcota bacterium]|nr:FAD-dependent oxidoreductase [Myxococcota bacterium]